MLTADALAHAGAWLLAQAAALPDTIVTKSAPLEPGWFERLSQILRALMTLAILALTIAVVPAAWNFRKSYKKFSDLLDRVYADVNPITHHAARIAENADYITTAIRADVQRVSASVADADRRLQDALRRAEGRVRDFDALVDVAQAEAEDTFVSTASSLRGVREGLARLRVELDRGGADILAPRRRGPARRPVRPDDVPRPDVPDELTLVDAHPELRAPTEPTLSGVPYETGAAGAYGAFDDELDAIDAALDEELAEEEDAMLDDFYEESDDAVDAEPGAAQRPRIRPRQPRRPDRDG